MLRLGSDVRVENNETLWIVGEAPVENSSLDVIVRSMALSGTEGAHQNPEVKDSERETTMPFVNMCVPEREMARTFCPMSLSGSEVSVPETDAALAGTEVSQSNREAALSAVEGALRNGEIAGAESALSLSAPLLSVAESGVSPVFQSLSVKNTELSRSVRRTATMESTRSRMFSTRGLPELVVAAVGKSMRSADTDARSAERSADTAE